MENTTEDMLTIDEHNTAVLIGILLGFVAGIIVAFATRSDTGIQARQRLATTVGEIDLSRGEGMVPAKVQESVQRGRDAVAVGRQRATDIVNQSPLPVTIGADGASDSDGSDSTEPDESAHSVESTASDESDKSHARAEVE